METQDKTHEACVMGEKWVWLEEQLKSMEHSRLLEDKNYFDKLTSYITSQSKINADMLNEINKLKHYIYEDGLNTKLALNKQTAETDIARVELSIATEIKAVKEHVDSSIRNYAAKVNWLWVGIGTIALMLAGNIFKHML